MVILNLEDIIELAIDSALKLGAQFADIRIEHNTGLRMEFVNNDAKKSIQFNEKGLGIRAFIDGAWGFSTLTKITKEAVKEAAEAATKLAKISREYIKEPFKIDAKTYKGKSENIGKKPIDKITIDEKTSYIKMLSEQAKNYDARIATVKVIYTDVISNKIIANSFGTFVEMKISLPRVSIMTTAREGTNRQRGYKSVGLSGGFEIFDSEKAQKLGEESAKQAIMLLSAKAAPSGVFDVVADPELTGVFVHEAFGHASEADAFTAKNTVLEDKLGKKVGNESVNLSDDPTIPGLRGSFEYDSEGTKTRKRHLVVNGVLNEILHSLETAARLGLEPNGAARAQDYGYMPIPRMSNTFMEPGDWTKEEIIEDTKKGILMAGFEYGYVEPAVGQFMFKSWNGWIIEKGELKTPIRDAALAGIILEVLNKINAIGKVVDFNPGVCGKSMQSVPVMTGGPYIRIERIPIGGQ